MALIECPECGRAISAEATACPQCGLPLPARVAVQRVVLQADQKRQKLVGSIRFFVTAGIYLLVAGLGAGVLAPLSVVAILIWFALAVLATLAIARRFRPWIDRACQGMAALLISFGW
jgi:zinc-ribbon domain